ncbi:hypothetical protein JKG47_09385 [Acidithiobacillus sp. MC6.1]|nr:hypothetical protein [Acidithiobacillus sp. MC6.1]MBU2764926.1 hypothetical protein [Acidithiobacillus ferrivorans]
MEKALKDSIEDILREREKAARIHEGIKEAVKAAAERFDMKPAQLSKIVGLIEKDREKGGVIDAEREMLDMAADIS